MPSPQRPGRPAGTARPQRPRHPLRLGRRLAVGEPPRAVDHSGLVWPYPRRPLEERQRRHRHGSWLVLAGDREMITSVRIEAVKELGGIGSRRL
jgi:hypothetical protein